MGDRGAGNFDSDTALDWYAEFSDGLLTAIEDAMRDPECLRADEYEGEVVPCQIQVLCELDERGHRPQWPAPDVLAQWKQTYLRVWDESVDALEPAADQKQARRATLVATFDRMLELAQAAGA